MNKKGYIEFGKLLYEGKYYDYEELSIEELTKDTGFKSCVLFEEGIEKTISYINNSNFALE